MSTTVDAQGMLRVGLRPIDPLALWVDGSYGKSESKGTGHSGTGFGGAVGASLVWPGERLRPALSAQLGTQRSTASIANPLVSDTGETETESLERSTSSNWLLHVDPLLVWGSGAQGATLWFGAEYTAWGVQTLDMKVDEVTLNLKPDQRVGLLLGAELRSDALGMPGRRRSYLSAGAQLQALAGAGLHAWVGWSF